MASLLVPVSLAARLVKTKTPVPSISGAPFNTDLMLEPGIHIHWALPDALTTAKSPNPPPVPGVVDTTPYLTIFPGVPDLWLVTRFNPPVAGQATRQWKAWVVDSRAQTVTPLDSWTGPTASDPKFVHTLPGLLPAATRFPGWGQWDGSLTPTAAQQGNGSQFDAALTSAIYYPTGRRRFGFYDDLSGLPSSGTVSYTVVGWYSSETNDPLAQSSNREQQIADWKFSYEHHDDRFTLATLVATGGAVPAVTFQPKLVIAETAAPAKPALQAKAFALETVTRANQAKTIQAALGTAANSAVLAPLYTYTKPASIVCHGSVMDIALNTNPTAFTLAASKINLYPTPKRALAALVSPTLTGQQLDYAEMVLQDLDHLKGTTSGVMDMPGAAHALTFQSVPGKPLCYAQMRVYDFEIRLVDPPIPFQLTPAAGTAISGHWPEAFTLERKSSVLLPSASATILTQPRPQLSPEATFAPQPWIPTPADVATFQSNVAAAMSATATAATAAGTPIDPKMLRVTDRRANAQPVRLGPSVNGSGTDAGGYWVDTTDPDAMTQLLINTAGAAVDLPDFVHIYAIPGPRWYRPWSPQIVLQDAGRTYRFGEDGRYDPVNGALVCRTSGYTVYSIASSSGTPVLASSVLANAQSITAKSGLPADTRALLGEALLLDTGSAAALAVVAATAPQRAAAETYFVQAIRGLYLERLPDLSAQTQTLLKSIVVKGTQPSPAALTPWKPDTFEALFLDTNYSLQYSPIETGWELDEDQVEMTATAAPASGPPVALTERTRVTANMVKVAQSRLVTRATTNPIGRQVARQDAPNGITSQVFQSMDTLSAPLVGFDLAVFAKQYRQRAGTLSVNNVSVIDIFGVSRTFNAGSAPGPSTMMFPRLPYWSRLKLRLQSAADLTVEANSHASSVCAILLPDFLDHSVQIFDCTGNSIGQLDHDPANGALVRFTPFPWFVASLPPGANVLSSINPTLSQLISGIVAQHNDVPAGMDSANHWHDTALTALLRVIDTVRATLDPSYSTPDRKVSLLGEPILVMVASLKLETTAVTDRKQLALNPATLAQPPACPSISVRIGDITRPNDGVLGIFQPGATPDQSKFAPVSIEAAQHAILNGLTEGIVYNSQLGEPVTHPFVLNQVNRIAIQADTPQNVILLTDIRGDIYASSGVLPRKSITVPKDFLDAALTNMEPVFAVGPVFTVTSSTGTVLPLFPPPQVQGYDASFAPDGGDPAQELPMPPATPLGDLPLTRVKLDEGWMRLKKRTA
jgi:hypothetical protein